MKGQTFTQLRTDVRPRFRHKFPILRRNRFYTGVYDESLGIKRTLLWINANGQEMEEGHWNDPSTRCFGMLMDGRAQKSGIRKQGDNATILLVLNGHHDIVEFTLPSWAMAATSGYFFGGYTIKKMWDIGTKRHKVGDRYAVTGQIRFDLGIGI